MELKTNRLILRDLKISDFDDMQKYASDPESTFKVGWGPNDEAATRAFLKEAEKSAQQTPRVKYDFAVVEKESGRMAGSCGIYLDENLEQGMIGYILHKDVWGRGYGTELVRELIRLSFEELRLHRIYATSDCDNPASYRLMEKNHMRLEGRFAKNRRREQTGEWIDTCLYAILQEEYRKRAENV